MKKRVKSKGRAKSVSVKPPMRLRAKARTASVRGNGQDRLEQSEFGVGTLLDRRWGKLI
jgi:hypothetical protein